MGSQKNDVTGTCTSTKMNNSSQSSMTLSSSCGNCRKTLRQKNANKKMRFCSETHALVVKNVNIRSIDH